jgi:aminopeptidase N
VLEKQTETGKDVELYSFDDALIQAGTGTLDSATFALNIAILSLETYEHFYGPYPYQRLVVIEGDFPDGMEFSGLVFVGGEYFRRFEGATSYLTIITAHEVAHQWWYDQVGNDQAINPWLDEALATYSEYIFIQQNFPSLSDWWWEFRINRFSPEGFVDSTVYEFSSRRAYINAVYLRGVEMLDDLRNILGDDVFFDWLRQYVQTGYGKIMTPERFWSLLTPEQYERTASIRKQYLKSS